MESSTVDSSEVSRSDAREHYGIRIFATVLLILGLVAVFWSLSDLIGLPMDEHIAIVSPDMRAAAADAVRQVEKVWGYLLYLSLAYVGVFLLVGAIIWMHVAPRVAMILVVMWLALSAYLTVLLWYGRFMVVKGLT